MPALAPEMPSKLARSAFALFAEHGFERVSLDEVAADAGVTKGSLYHHYCSKKDVILAACNYYYRRWQRQTHAAITPLTDPLERLGRVVSESVRSCIMDESNRVFTTEVFALSLHDRDVRAGWGQFYDTVRELYVGLVEAAKAAGQVHVDDPRRAVNLMLTAMEGVKQRALFEPDICTAADQQMVVEDLMRILGATARRAKQ